jgi:hypothetical protein
VRRQPYDRAAGGQPTQPIRDEPDGAVVQSGERLVQQHEPRRVQQRALEREPLTHAARERADGFVTAIGQTRRRERFVDRRARVEAVELREEAQVLARRQLRIQVQLVREEPDARPQRRAKPPRGRVAVADFAFRRRGKRRQHGDERRFAGPVGPQ